MRAKSTPFDDSIDPLDPTNCSISPGKIVAIQSTTMFIPREMTGVNTNIVVLHSVHFRTGSPQGWRGLFSPVEKELFVKLTKREYSWSGPRTGKLWHRGRSLDAGWVLRASWYCRQNMSRRALPKIEGYGARNHRHPGI